MKVIYYGVFFDKNECKKIHKLDENPLDRIYDNLHVTFRYDPHQHERINDIVGKSIKLKIVGRGNNGKNSGLLVEIPEEYKKYYIHRYIKDGKTIKVTPHITTSLSYDSSSKQTKDLRFEKLDKEIIVEGRFGYCVSDGDKRKIIYKEVL